MLTSFSVALQFFIDICRNFRILLQSIPIIQGVSLYTLLVGVLLVTGIIAIFVRRSGG